MSRHGQPTHTEMLEYTIRRLQSENKVLKEAISTLGWVRVFSTDHVAAKMAEDAVTNVLHQLYGGKA